VSDLTTRLGYEIDNMFERIDWNTVRDSNEEIIAAFHEMGYIDLADAYFNWTQEA
jgi:hypothetical protein